MLKNLFIIIAVILFLAPAGAKANQLSFDQVEASSISIFGTDTALDSLGQPAICYQDTLNGDLKVAFQVNGMWQIETTDDNGQERGSAGGQCSLIFDNNDVVHVAHYNDRLKELRHTRKTANGWQTLLIDNDARMDANLIGSARLSLSKNAQGEIGIAYYDPTGRDLLYASWNGLNWTTEEAATRGDVGRYASLQFNALNQPVIAYQRRIDDATSALEIISKDGLGVWNTIVIDDSGVSGSFNSLVLDENGMFHVAYQKTDADGIQHLAYANNVGGAWESRILKSGSARWVACGAENDMAFGADGNLHLISKYNFASALFGRSNYVKMFTLYQASDSNPDAIRVLEENAAFSAGWSRFYGALSLSADARGHVFYAGAFETFGGINYTLYAGQITSWSPFMALLTPAAGNNRAANDRLTVTWSDFDPDSNAAIRFRARDALFQETVLNESANENDAANEIVLDVSGLAPEEYSLYAEISDNDFAWWWTASSPSVFIVPARPVAAAPAAPQAPAAPMAQPPQNEARPADAPAAPAAPVAPVAPRAADQPAVLPENPRMNRPPWPPKPAESDLEELKVIIENSIDDDGDPLTYEIQICMDDACIEVMVVLSGITPDEAGMTTCNLEDEKLPEGTYYWRARAIDDGGESSDWSSPASLTVKSSTKETITGDDETGSENGEDDTTGSPASGGGCSLTAESAEYPSGGLTGLFMVLGMISLFLATRKFTYRQSEASSSSASSLHFS
ncbi:MAG: hypothetical protein Q7T11_04735 [Deltaproteobacteria bacterium]|nr:hypothetical protein [Deltaproteobacteria bacterium]